MSRRRNVSANSWLTFNFSIYNSSLISPLSFSSFPRLFDRWHYRTPLNCAPWILFLYSMYTRKRRDVPFFSRSTAKLRRKREKNGEIRLTRCARPVPFPLRSSSLPLPASPYSPPRIREEVTRLPLGCLRLRPIPPLSVSSRSTSSSIDVISRWSLHEYILWLRRFTNKLNICFNSRSAVVFPLSNNFNNSFK